MRILVAHNSYLYAGGEDRVVDSEVGLLRSYGHQVECHFRHNSELTGRQSSRVATQAIWSSQTTRDIRAHISSFRPHVIHAHNTFPLISPSLYWIANEANIPVVQTLHNFRLLCPQAMLLRNGKVCEDCIGRVPWRAVLRRCYRGSASQTAVSAAVLVAHRMIGSYSHKVARFIALSSFSFRKFVAGGLPKEKLVVKENFVDAPHPPRRSRSGGLFVGRLSQEKGISVLLRALQGIETSRFRIIGTGPEEYKAQESKAHLLGFVDQHQLYKYMWTASYLVVPSIWYENCPRVLLEAFACGVPVIASRLGALPEFVQEGHNGLLFHPGSETDLAEKIQWAEDHPLEMAEMGRNARLEYEKKYTPNINYQRLIDIYEEAINTC